MDKVRKPWGWTREVERSAFHSVHHIEIEPGGFCSVHLHAHKNNIFVIAGASRWSCYVEVFADDRSLARRYRLGLHMPSFTVKAGVLHRFWAPSGAQAIEIYTTLDGQTVEDNDIYRISDGGVVTGSPPLFDEAS